MAISLKNIEDRVKVLENTSGSSFAPDVSRRQSVSNNFTAPSDGWITAYHAYGKVVNSSVKLNGVEMTTFVVSDGFMPNGGWTIPIGKGQKLTIVNIRECYFIPVKMYYILTAWLKGWWLKWLSA